MHNIAYYIQYPLAISICSTCSFMFHCMFSFLQNLFVIIFSWQNIMSLETYQQSAQMDRCIRVTILTKQITCYYITRQYALSISS